MVGTGRIQVTVRPHRVNAVVLRALARAFVLVDGGEHPAAWGEPLVVAVAAGQHEVAAFLRYRGTRASLGTGRLVVAVTAGQVTGVEARNGWANHMPFVPRLAAAPVPGQRRRRAWR